MYIANFIDQNDYKDILSTQMTFLMKGTPV